MLKGRSHAWLVTASEGLTQEMQQAAVGPQALAAPGTASPLMDPQLQAGGTGQLAGGTGQAAGVEGQQQGEVCD